MRTSVLIIILVICLHEYHTKDNTQSRHVSTKTTQLLKKQKKTNIQRAENAGDEEDDSQSEELNELFKEEHYGEGDDNGNDDDDDDDDDDDGRMPELNESSNGFQVIEPIGYEATGFNFPDKTDREMEGRPFNNEENYADKHQFIKDGNSFDKEEENTDEGPQEENEDLMEENVDFGNKKDTTLVKALPSKTELIDGFQQWEKEFVKERPEYQEPGKFAMLMSQFKSWLADVLSGNYKASNKFGLKKLFDDLLITLTGNKKKKEEEEEKQEKDENENKQQETKVQEDNYKKLRNMMMDAFKKRQKLINDLRQNVTKLTDKSRQETLKLLRNATGIITDIDLDVADDDNIDIMKLNAGYHVQYPANHLAFYLHQPIKNKHPTTYHVKTTKGGYIVHHFYNTGRRKVNHYILQVKPCMNGGVVVPLGGEQFQCICKNGFIGQKCEEFDYCSLKPCKNHGKCYSIDTPPRIQCACLREYYGSKCEKKNPCFPNTCKNGGSCSHNDDGKSECICRTGYKGDKCQFLNSCVPSPCLNGGNCRQVDDQRFTCECSIQFKGPLCQYSTICSRMPCNNGGTCRESEEDGNFQCICPKGFIGKTCDERPCAPNPCLNGGTCIEEGNNKTCICTRWTKGETCEIVTPCKVQPCGSNGRCVDAESGYKVEMKSMQYYCLCKPPYMGPGCKDNICNHCSPNGHCSQDKHCVCDDGYVGDGIYCAENVTNLCQPNPCMNDGKCLLNETGQFECKCKPPFNGRLCEENDACKADPCKNGRCQVKTDGSYFCKCLPGYSGYTCNVSEVCVPNPCQHSGVCSKDEQGKATCECIGQWRGSVCQDCNCKKSKDPLTIPDAFCDQKGYCECYQLNGLTFDYSMIQGCQLNNADAIKPATPCDSKPCLNGGTCMVSGDDQSSYTCTCTKWFMGKNCGFLKACVPNNPCLNGGTCTEDGDGDYTCKCLQGFLQPICAAQPPVTTPEPPHCVPNPCLNEGVCKSAFDGFDCDCKSRYTGPKCEIDRCKDCSKHAHCELGHCICDKGYVGSGYECQIDDTYMPRCGRCPQYAICEPSTGRCACRRGYMNKTKCAVLPTTSPSTLPATSPSPTVAWEHNNETFDYKNSTEFYELPPTDNITAQPKEPSNSHPGPDDTTDFTTFGLTGVIHEQQGSTQNDETSP